jgi:putative ATPase
LAQAVAHLALAKKSIQIYKAYGRAKSLVASQPAYPVPLHIRNAPTKLIKDLDYGVNYRYNPDFAHPVHQTYMPPELEGQADFFKPSHLGDTVDEKALAEWEALDNAGRLWEGRSALQLSSKLP